MTGPDDPTRQIAGSQPSRALIGAVVGLVAIGVIGWLVLFSGMFGGDADPSGTPSAEPSPSASDGPSVVPSPSEEPTPEPTEAPTSTPEPSADAGPIEVAWTPATGIEPSAQISAVKYLDGRWIAVGGVFGDEAIEAAIWTSDDGANWTQGQINSTRQPGEATHVLDVAELDGTLVAIGSWGIVPSDQRAWMTWSSTDDGASWTESREGPTPSALSAVAPGGPGLVAAGWTYAGTSPFDSYFATSDDGIGWELTGAMIDNAQVNDLAVIGDRIVAVGHTWTATGATDATAWYSDDDGATWTAVDVPDGGSQLSMIDLVAFGDGLVAIGNGGDANVALFVSASWVTADGEAWEAFEVASGATANAVGSAGGGLVAVGNFAAHDIGPGVAWISTDAEAWTEGEQLGDGSVRLSAVGGEGDVLVAGGQCQSDACDGVIWVGEVSR